MISSPECTDIADPIQSGREIYRKGVALSRDGRHEEALLAFSDALAADPTHALAWVGRGFALGETRTL